MHSHTHVGSIPTLSLGRGTATLSSLASPVTPGGATLANVPRMLPLRMLPLLLPVCYVVERNLTPGESIMLFRVVALAQLLLFPCFVFSDACRDLRVCLSRRRVALVLPSPFCRKAFFSTALPRGLLLTLLRGELCGTLLRGEWLVLRGE